MAEKDPLEDTPQILRIKKGAVQYDDEKEDGPERPSPRPVEQRKPPQSPTGQRARRRPLSALLPIVILVVAVLVIYRVMPQKSDHASVGSSEALLRAEAIGDSLHAAVAVSPSETEGGRVTVLFRLPDTGEQLSVSDLMTASGLILKGSMPFTGKERSIEARVTIDGASATLYAKIVQQPGP
jgi:hypothetical protein